MSSFLEAYQSFVRNFLTLADGIWVKQSKREILKCIQQIQLQAKNLLLLK